ncbi:MAG TPA: TRAP transporter small permease [Alphaproteobacteria bacterium]|nr:TRAP transporter small permease [Alphaproteobacteria bacterium]
MSTDKAAETAEAPTPLVERIASWFARAGAVVLAVMLMLTFADVIGREVLEAPIVANNEMTELLMGLVVYLGVGLTTRMRGHVRVDILLNILPDRVRAVANAVTLALCAVFVAAMSWQLYERAVVKFTKGDTTDLWKIPTWPVAGIMTLCAALMAVLLFMQWTQALRHAVTGIPPVEDDSPQGGL